MKKTKVLLMLFLLFINIEYVYADDDIFLSANDNELELIIEDTNVFKNNSERTLEYTYHDNKNNNGLWFSNSKDKDKNYVNIREYSDVKLTGDFIINSVSFNDVTISLTNSKGKINITNNADKYLKGRIIFKKSKYLSVVVNSNKSIYGLVGNFSNNNMKLIDCVSDDFEITNNNNRILFESIKGIDKGVIGICKFEKANKDIGYLYLNNINVSNKERMITHDNLELKISKPKINDVIYHQVYNYIDNTNNRFNIKKTILFVLIIISIIILLMILFKIRRSKKFSRRLKVAVIIIFFCLPRIVLAINDGTVSKSDLTKIRKYILYNYKLNDDDVIMLDMDKDSRITINDLIVAKIKYNTPNIVINDGDIKKNNSYEYYSDVNKKVTIESISNIKSLKYCYATDNYCEPSKNYEVSSNNVVMNIKFDGNKKPQKIFVEAINVYDLKSYECDEKTYLVDNKVPELKVKNNKVYIGIDDKYDINSNVNPVYGVSGGKYSCDGKIDYGNNTIKCNIIGNNGLSNEIKYEIIKSKTYKKNAIFFGDSITYGYGNNGYGWGNFIGDNYDFAGVVNAGKSGWFISNNLNRDWIVDIVKSQKGNNYDYVIMHGGCNDINKNVPLGTFNNEDFSGEYDTNTFLGGLEYYLYNVTNNWPHAKMGYIINYRTPNNDGRNNEKSAEYYSKMKEVLKKWNISYLDLFDGKSDSGEYYSDLLKVTTNEYLPDTLHLNKSGYKVIYPYIYNWLKELDSYS